jgi:hypothetical protein
VATGVAVGILGSGVFVGVRVGVIVGVGEAVMVPVEVGVGVGVFVGVGVAVLVPAGVGVAVAEVVVRQLSLASTQLLISVRLAEEKAVGGLEIFSDAVIIPEEV